MAIAAAPAVAAGARAVAGKTAAKKTARKTASKKAPGGAPGGGGKPPGGGGPPKKPAPGGGAPDLPGGGGGGGRSSSPDRPWRDKGRTQRTRAFAGAEGRWRRWLIAEFIICVMLLGLSPLAKKPGEMGPRRFMKRGSATCAFFIILGLVSAGGRGAAKAAAMFGALVTLVLLVDQREAFGKLATTLNTTEADEKADAAAFAEQLGPDDSTDADDGGEESMAV